jgi:hypothetical protein
MLARTSGQRNSTWMLRRSLLALSVCLLTSKVHAGPVELFTGVSVDPKMPNSLALKYIYGGGGLFMSTDAGMNFQMLCYSAIDPSVERDVSTVYISGNESIYIGVFDGLWRGDKSGCNWQSIADLKGKWVSDIAGDPTDPAVTYAVTSNGTGLNSVYMNDGKSDIWTVFGSQSELFLNTLHVVKTSAGKRFYETAVKTTTTMDPTTGMAVDDIHYTVRVSDDNAKTWTESDFGPPDQYGPKDPLAEVRVLAVDPNNPDHILAAVTRDMDVDDLVYSASQGKAWMPLGKVTTLQAAVFKPDGSLVYGDDSQDSPGLFVIDKIGDNPRQISKDWKVGCLQYDATHTRMYACKDWQFGTADLTTGAFSLMLDMRKADKFVECPGKPPAADTCKTQLLAAYCGISHYPEAPLCCGYPRPGYDPVGCGGASGASGAAAGGMSGGAAGMSSAAGGAGMAAAGSMAAPATAGSAAGRAAAGSGGSALPPKAKSGCSVATPGHATSPAWLALAVGLSVVAGGWRRRRAR